MTNEEKLSKAFKEVIWMAIRYADGRSTYAPQMVRDAVKLFQEVNPDWKPQRDSTITQPCEEILEVKVFLKSDYLHDLVNQNK